MKKKKSIQKTTLILSEPYFPVKTQIILMESHTLPLTKNQKT